MVQNSEPNIVPALNAETIYWSDRRNDEDRAITCSMGIQRKTKKYLVYRDLNARLGEVEDYEKWA